MYSFDLASNVISDEICPLTLNITVALSCVTSGRFSLWFHVRVMLADIVASGVTSEFSTSTCEPFSSMSTVDVHAVASAVVAMNSMMSFSRDMAVKISKCRKPKESMVSCEVFRRRRLSPEHIVVFVSR